MTLAMVLAVAAALAVSGAGLILRRPRRWVVRTGQRAWESISPRQHERDRAEITSLSADLAGLREAQTSNLAIIDRQSAELAELRARSDQAELAAARVAAHLTEDLCRAEGNPDDEYRADLDAWFRGDPDANIDYSRKQARDMARLAAGEFRRR